MTFVLKLAFIVYTKEKSINFADELIPIITIFFRRLKWRTNRHIFKDNCLQTMYHGFDYYLPPKVLTLFTSRFFLTESSFFIYIALRVLNSIELSHFKCKVFSSSRIQIHYKCISHFQPFKMYMHPFLKHVFMPM